MSVVRFSERQSYESLWKNCLTKLGISRYEYGIPIAYNRKWYLRRIEVYEAEGYQLDDESKKVFLLLSLFPYKFQILEGGALNITAEVEESYFFSSKDYKKRLFELYTFFRSEHEIKTIFKFQSDVSDVFIKSFFKERGNCQVLGAMTKLDLAFTKEKKVIVIANNYPRFLLSKVRSLSLHGSDISMIGLRRVINNFGYLKSLNISSCENLNIGDVVYFLPLCKVTKNYIEWVLQE